MGAYPSAREPRHGAWGSRGEGQVPEIELSPRAKVATAAADLWVRDNAFGLGVRALQYAVKLLLFLVATFYLLLHWDRLGDRLRLLTPPEHRAELGALVGEIDAALRLYLRGLLVLIAL